MAIPSEDRPSSIPDATPSWRPTAQSYRNLAAFAAALAISSGLVLGFTRSVLLVVATAGIVLVAVTSLAVVLTGRKLRAALADAERPKLGNWPGSDEERRELRHRGWIRCRRSVAMAVVIGGLGGFYPAIGVAFVGAGVAGTLGSIVVVAIVRRHEAANDVTVFSPSRIGGGPRRRLSFGVAPGRL